MSEAKIGERVSKLELNHRELASAVWGDDRTRDNGIRSMVREHDDRIHILECAERDTEDTRRALDDHLKAHAEMDAASVTMRTAALQVEGATKAAVVSSIGSILVGIGAIAAVVLK